MSTSKEIILKRIQKGLKDVPVDEYGRKSTFEHNYHVKSPLTKKELAIQFSARLSEYRATVKVTKEVDLITSIGEACLVQNVKRLVLSPGIPDHWLPESAGMEYLTDGNPMLSHQELDESHGVLTCCTLAVAQTGSIVLDGGPGQGRRALTLLPDFHLCVVYADQIVGIIPEAFRMLETRLHESGSPVTFISGPSATSDIELDRVEGVHGPRRLHVLIIDN